MTAAPSPQLARAELPWLASRWGPIAPPTSTATEMSVTSVTPHLGFGNERSGRHWLRADIFRSSVRSHTTATMVTTFPGPLYAGATVCAPQKTLNARMDPAGPSHDEPMRRVPGERPVAALGPRREGPNPTTGFPYRKVSTQLADTESHASFDGRASSFDSSGHEPSLGQNVRTVHASRPRSAVVTIRSVMICHSIGGAVIALLIYLRVQKRRVRPSLGRKKRSQLRR